MGPKDDTNTDDAPAAGVNQTPGDAPVTPPMGMPGDMPAGDAPMTPPAAPGMPGASADPAMPGAEDDAEEKPAA